MNLIGLDHFVLTVRDVEASCAFYEQLGADVVTFEEDRKALHLGEQKINLHEVDNDIELVAEDPTTGGDDFCLVTDMPIGDVERRLREQDIEIIAGPVEQSGAIGTLTSVYFRDPDTNLVEIGTYNGD